MWSTALVCCPVWSECTGLRWKWIEMPVSLAFLHRSSKFWCRWIQDIVLNNLLIGCETTTFNFHVEKCGFLQSHAHRDFIILSSVCSGFYFWCTKIPRHHFCRHWSRDCTYHVSCRLVKIPRRSYILSVFHKTQNGGKSKSQELMGPWGKFVPGEDWHMCAKYHDSRPNGAWDMPVQSLHDWRYRCSKFAISIGCYSAPLWPIDVIIAVWPHGITH